MTDALVPLIARFLIGFIYVFAGVSNIYYHERLINHMSNRKVPYSQYVFWVGVILQIIGGLAVILNIFIVPAVILLIAFTLWATYMFHNFWDMTESEPFRLNTLKFVTNFSMIGGLMLVAYFYA